MCGLVGIFSSEDRRPIDRHLLETMTDSLAHRGPDGRGFLVDGGIGLGHRRLSIIDLAGGQQPMYNEDRSVAVVYNGEIYNRSEEHTSELQSLMRNSYAVFWLKK